MKIIISKLILLSLILVLSSCDTQTVIYLSPEGNDKSDASEGSPVKSIGAALELIRQDAGKLPSTIYFDDGTYFIENPIKLELSESGTENAPVRWKAIPGKNPVISGGVLIENWKIENKDLWSADLPKSIKSEFRSFYMNDRRATRARFPDSSYLRIKKSGKDRRTNFLFNRNEIPFLSNIEGLELVFLHDWSITRIGVKSIDWKNYRLTAVDSIGARLPFFNIDNWENQPRYFLENSMQFCDSPGEWYCDVQNRKLYYRPLSGENIKDAKGIIPIASNILLLNGEKEKKIKHISFEGITFAHTSAAIPSKGYCGVQASMFTNRSSNIKGWDQIPSAIELENASDIEFRNCTVKHTGGSGIWIGSNSSNCLISGVQIFDISGNGINIGEGSTRLVGGIPWWKSAPEEICESNIVQNSIIKDCGKQFYGSIGIWCGLVSNTRITNNEISNLPYSGISIGWMWDSTATPCRENKISANHIYNVMLTLSDGGGIYSLGRQPGSRIYDNIIHDVKVNAGRAESNGMFLDEGTRDLKVENNIIFNIAKSPLRFHKAFINTVRNNILVSKDGIPSIRYNSTKEDDIIKIDNTLLSQNSEEDLYYLRDALAERKRLTGPK